MRNAFVLTACLMFLRTACGATAGSAIAAGDRFQRQIDACAERGGGRVAVPAGTWESLPLRLASNVELHLAEGAKLVASTNRADYAALKLPYCEGDLMAVVMAHGVTNVAVTGRGEIDGRGDCWPQPLSFGGNQEGLRPRGLVFANCRDIRLEDFLLRDSPCWGIVLKDCVGAVARRVRIDSHANANNDGFDVEARNVLIEDCDVDSADDAYCLKSNNPNFTTENVVIRRCVGRSNCNPFKIGTASHGVVRHVRFENCRTEPPRRSFLSRVVAPGMAPPGQDWFYLVRKRWTSDPDRMAGMSGVAVECVDGGEVSDVVCRDLDIRGVMTPLFVRGGTRTGRSCGTPPGDRYVLKGVRFENVTAAGESYIASSVTGVKGCRPQDVLLKNVTIRCRPGTMPKRTTPVPERAGAYPEASMFGILPARGLYIRHADGVRLENVVFENADDGDVPTVLREDAPEPSP